MSIKSITACSGACPGIRKGGGGVGGPKSESLYLFLFFFTFQFFRGGGQLRK